MAAVKARKGMEIEIEDLHIQMEDVVKTKISVSLGYTSGGNCTNYDIPHLYIMKHTFHFSSRCRNIFFNRRGSVCVNVSMPFFLMLKLKQKQQTMFN